MSVAEGLIAATLVGGTLLLVGSPLLYRGLKHRTRYRRFRETPVETPATATPGETALLAGTARQSEGGAVDAPLSGTRAVLAAWDVHSLRRYGLLGVKRVWGQEALGVDAGEFELHGDGTELVVADWSHTDRIEGTERLSMTDVGLLPVSGLDVEGLWVEIDEFDIERRTLPGEELPDRCRRLGSRVGVDRPEEATRLLPPLPRIRMPEGTLRYREATVRDGQEVTVLGTVREPLTPDGPPRVVEPENRPPLVSPLDPETLLGRYRRSYWKWTYGLAGVVLLVASIAGLAVAL